jgi:hypothetical protein
LAQALATLHVVYGLLAGGISGIFVLKLIADPQSAGGCCGGSFAPVFLALFGVVFLLALPQLFAATLFLRGHPSGALSMRRLSVLNLVVNLATVSLVIVAGGASFALWWVPFLAINVAGIFVFKRAAPASELD